MALSPSGQCRGERTMRGHVCAVRKPEPPGRGSVSQVEPACNSAALGQGFPHTIGALSLNQRVGDRYDRARTAGQRLFHVVNDVSPPSGGDLTRGFPRQVRPARCRNLKRNGWHWHTEGHACMPWSSAACKRTARHVNLPCDVRQARNSALPCLAGQVPSPGPDPARPVPTRCISAI